ncbi:MAG: ABC transporter substrate-binding protein [Alphaproteobacteria bacterium]|nr:MAG: ABC transporter substrate-binding protein [Alphaproteobacteria bacterium]
MGITARLRHTAFAAAVLALAACNDKPAEEENTAQFAPIDNTQEVLDYYAAHPEFFRFKTPADIPADLVWEDGQNLSEIGSPNAKKGGTWTERLQDFPRTLRLVGPDSNGSFRPFILDYVRPNFANYHPNEFELYPGIADRWAVDKENKRVYLHIDEAARWSDGEPITADDVVFSFFFFQSSYIVQPWYNDFYTNQLTGVTKFDDHTLAFDMPAAKPDMAHNALTWSPVPEHFFKELGPDYPDRYQWRFVPSPGPYILDDGGLQKGRSVTLKRVDDWWLKDRKFYKYRFNFDKLRFIVIRDTPKAFESFKRGELDRFNLNTPEYWYEKLPDSDADVQDGYIHKVRFYNEIPRPSWGLWINRAQPHLDNRDVRVGINYAANWDLVIEKYFRGDFVRMRTTADGYGPFTHPTLTARPYDIDKAMEAFARAGFVNRGPDGILMNDKGERLSFTLTTGYERFKDILPILKEEAAKAGLDLRLEVLDATASWKKTQEKKHDLQMVAFASQLEMYPRYWETYHSSNAYDLPFLADGSVNPNRKLKTQTNNLQSIAIPELDALIDQYRFNDDAEDMKRLAFQMEEILYEDASFVPGWVQPYYRVGHWRWMQFPKGFTTKHSRWEYQHFVAWVDEDIKRETKEARKRGESFGPAILTFDQYKSEVE